MTFDSHSTYCQHCQRTLADKSESQHLVAQEPKPKPQPARPEEMPDNTQGLIRLDGTLQDVLDEAASHARADGFETPRLFHIVYAFARLITAAPSLDAAGISSAEIRRTLRRMIRTDQTAQLIASEEIEQRAIADVFSYAAADASESVLYVTDIAVAIVALDLNHPLVAQMEQLRVAAPMREIVPPSPEPTQHLESTQPSRRGSQVTSLLSSAEQDATTPEVAAVASDATVPGAAPGAVAMGIAAKPQLSEYVPAELPAEPHHTTLRQQTSDTLHDRDILSDRMSCREAPRIASVLEALALHVQALGQMQQDAARVARDEYGSRLRQLETDVGELLTLTKTLVERIDDLSNHVLLTEQTRNGPANDTREPAHEHLDGQEPLSDQQRFGDRRATDRWPMARLGLTRRLKPRAERRSGYWSPPHTSSTSETPDPPVATPDPHLGSETRATRYFLSMEDDIVAAPSIGPRTADRMRSIGISRVRDFLDADPEEIAAEIGTSYLTANAVADWQDQSGLMLMIPDLRVTHAQLLVGAGFRSAWAIQAADAADVQAAVLRFAVSREGQRVLRDSPAPPADRIHNWIENAARADAKRAA
ncbi:MAG: DUF4332 domain-containing protein [Pseudomonadota bacterium]